eukprot:1076317-Pleurochrysis_carterae.AAC.2
MPWPLSHVTNPRLAARPRRDQIGSLQLLPTSSRPPRASAKVSAACDFPPPATLAPQARAPRPRTSIFGYCEENN